MKGDLVNVSGTWCKVRRINKKSVSVPWIVGSMSTGEESTHSDTVPWDKVSGRRRDDVQLDTPNGEPWPVALAVRVSRWGRAVASAERAWNLSFDDPGRTAARYVGWAQRIVHGLELSASDEAVEACRPSDVAALRELASTYLAVFDRLRSGESVADVTAWVTAAGRKLVSPVAP